MEPEDDHFSLVSALWAGPGLRPPRGGRALGARVCDLQVSLSGSQGCFRPFSYQTQGFLGPLSASAIGLHGECAGGGSCGPCRLLLLE